MWNIEESFVKFFKNATKRYCCVLSNISTDYSFDYVDAVSRRVHMIHQIWFNRIILRIMPRSVTHRLRTFNKVQVMIDAGVSIRSTASAGKNPGSNTVLFAIADKRTTAVTLINAKRHSQLISLIFI